MIEKAIQVSVNTQKEWECSTPIEERIKIWNTAACMMADSCRQELNAATMLGQSKTVIQAEIDSAAELVDFFRYLNISLLLLLFLIYLNRHIVLFFSEIITNLFEILIMKLIV